MVKSLQKKIGILIGEKYKDCIEKLREKSYNITSELDRGAQGIVYNLDDDKVVKIIDLRENYNINAMNQEIHSYEVLKDTRITPKIYDVFKCKPENRFSDPFLGFIIMEKLFQISDPYKINISKLISKLHKMHDKDIAHMDIKPDNIMVSKSDSGSNSKVFFIDFGMAIIYSGGTINFISQNNFLYKTLDLKNKKEAFVYDYIRLLIILYLFLSVKKLINAIIKIIEYMKKEAITIKDISGSKKISNYVYTELKEYDNLDLYNKFNKIISDIYNLPQNEQINYLKKEVKNKYVSPIPIINIIPKVK